VCVPLNLKFKKKCTRREK